MSKNEYLDGVRETIKERIFEYEKNIEALTTYLTVIDEIEKLPPRIGAPPTAPLKTEELPPPQLANESQVHSQTEGGRRE